MEDQCGHGLNTNETRIHFRVQSVFYRWHPPSFVSFVYFVVPILRGNHFPYTLPSPLLLDLRNTHNL